VVRELFRFGSGMKKFPHENEKIPTPLPFSFWFAVRAIFGSYFSLIDGMTLRLDAVFLLFVSAVLAISMALNFNHYFRTGL